MKIIQETPRLILRELVPSDDEGMFALDSDPLVHQYLGNNPIHTIEQARNVIAMVRQQYEDNGIARWAVIEKSSGDFIGWSGLKLVKEYENNHINFYDVGYRLIPKYWGQGYATESAMAAIHYGFTEIKMREIIGTANVDNHASRKALEKCGLTFVEQFTYQNTILCDWLKISIEDWKKNSGK